MEDSRTRAFYSPTMDPRWLLSQLDEASKEDSRNLPSQSPRRRRSSSPTATTTDRSTALLAVQSGIPLEVILASPVDWNWKKLLHHSQGNREEKPESSESSRQSSSDSMAEDKTTFSTYLSPLSLLTSSQDTPSLRASPLTGETSLSGSWNWGKDDPSKIAPTPIQRKKALPQVDEEDDKRKQGWERVEEDYLYEEFAVDALKFSTR